MKFMKPLNKVDVQTLPRTSLIPQTLLLKTAHVECIYLGQSELLCHAFGHNIHAHSQTITTQGC